MPRYDFDMITIGAGSGGVASSRRAGSYGARVAIVEESRIGGTCVLRGCVPKKLFVHAARYAEDFEDAVGFGWRLEGLHFDWPTLAKYTAHQRSGARHERREAQEELARQGYNMRVYVPYGQEWYPYFMRRLAERPANVVFVLGNLVRR